MPEHLPTSRMVTDSTNQSKKSLIQLYRSLRILVYFQIILLKLFFLITNLNEPINRQPGSFNDPPHTLTLNPTTLDPKPYTLNPKPRILNPKP